MTDKVNVKGKCKVRMKCHFFSTQSQCEQTSFSDKNFFCQHSKFWKKIQYFMIPISCASLTEIKDLNLNTNLHFKEFIEMGSVLDRK